MKDFFSVIIPVRIPTLYLQETIAHLKLQSYKKFEVIVVTDKVSKSPNPAIKRNYGASIAKGNILAFLDDDSYPTKDWLSNVSKVLKSNKNLAAVCGPCLTPSNDSITQKASGLVWASFLGSGGAGTYRNQIQSLRFVNDFPSVNLLVSKKSFIEVGGFKTDHWPGEDTLLCRDLIFKLKQKILYHPSVVVFHHRRSVILPHLRQIQRYALHRGYFAKKYPENSRQIGYFIPSLFSLYIFSLPFALLNKIVLYPLFIYLLLLLLTFLNFLYKKNSFLPSLLAIITIPLTHLYYGVLFIYGFFSPQPPFKPHQYDKNQKIYLGG